MIGSDLRVRPVIASHPMSKGSPRCDAHHQQTIPGRITGSSARCGWRSLPRRPRRHVSTCSASLHPGARTAWARHGLGQTLYVTEASAWYSGAARPQVIDAGDVVCFGPNEDHWDGAAPSTS